MLSAILKRGFACWRMKSISWRFTIFLWVCIDTFRRPMPSKVSSAMCGSAPIRLMCSRRKPVASPSSGQRCRISVCTKSRCDERINWESGACQHPTGSEYGGGSGRDCLCLSSCSETTWWWPFFPRIPFLLEAVLTNVWGFFSLLRFCGQARHLSYFCLLGSWIPLHRNRDGIPFPGYVCYEVERMVRCVALLLHSLYYGARGCNTRG